MRNTALFLLLLSASLLAACTPGRGGRGGGDDDDSAQDDDDATAQDDDDATAPDDDDATPPDDDDVTPPDDDDAAPDGTLSTCSNQGNQNQPMSQSAACPTDGLLFDQYVINVSAGDCIHIFADNGSAGAGDLLALAIDGNGDYYGGQKDFSQLDDETPCSVTPGSGPYGCPEASVVAENSGQFMIAVGQWGWDGCTTAAYTLFVAVNGSDVSPTLATNDAPLPGR